MAIIRNIFKNEDAVTSIGTIGFLCAISCAIVMLWFRGFKASLNFSSGKSHRIEHYDTSPGVSLIGAYRTNKDEQYDNIRPSEPPKKTSSTARLSVKHPGPYSNQSKSTSNLSKPSNDVNFRKSAPNISQTSTSQLPNNDSKTQKKLEKQRIAEQAKQEKLAAKERLREEKMRKESEKNIQRTREAEERRSIQKKSKKRTAPQPQQQLILRDTNVTSNSQPQVSHTTNTLESSISKSSGPPPYSSQREITPNQNDNTGNTSFAKPVDDTNSWDIISQHRQHMSRQPDVSKNITKQTHLDLHYNDGASRSNGNINSNAKDSIYRY